MINVAQPELEPAPMRTVHIHDGFYGRFMLGPIYGHTSVSSDSSSHQDYEVGGLGITIDAMVGGSPSPGFALGGAASFNIFGSSDDGTSTLTMLGAFVDGFPELNGGFHLGGQAGLAFASTGGGKNGRNELGGVGVGASVWLGQGFWVSDDVSLGGILRFDGAITRDGSTDSGPEPALSGFTYIISLGVTVLDH